MPVESSPPLPCPTPCHLLPNCTSCLASKGADGGWQHCVWSSSLQQVMPVSCCQPCRPPAPALLSFLLPLAISLFPPAFVITTLSLPAGRQPLCSSSSYSEPSETLPERAGRTQFKKGKRGLEMCLVAVGILDRHRWLGLNYLPHCPLLDGPDCTHLAQFSCPSGRQKPWSAPVRDKSDLPSIITSSKKCLIPTDAFSSCIPWWHGTQW